MVEIVSNNFEVWHAHVALITIIVWLALRRETKVNRMMDVAQNMIITNAREISELSSFTKDMLYNHIEVSLNREMLRILYIQPNYEYDRAFLHFVKVDSINHVSANYLHIRTLRTYGAIVQYVKDAKISILAPKAATICPYFHFLEKTQEGYVISSFPRDMIATMDEDIRRANEDLLKELRVYSTKDIELNALRTEVAKAFTNLVIKLQFTYLAVLPEIRQLYGNTDSIPQLIADNKVAEALDRLSIKNYDQESFRILTLIRSAYSDIQQRNISGLGVAREEVNKIKDSILKFIEYEHKIAN